MMTDRMYGIVRYPIAENTTPATIEKNRAFARTAPASPGRFSAKRRAVNACVPTEIALSEPPNSHRTMSDGRSAACAFDDSGHGRCAKKTMSTSLTMLWVSIAATVGSASRRMARWGGPEVTAFEPGADREI